MKIGKVPENVLKRSVLRQIQTKREEVVRGAGIGEDCAFFSFGSRVVMTCMQTAAVRTEGLDFSKEQEAVCIGQLIQRCANNLAAAGAEPVGVMIALTLPPDTEEAKLKALMTEASAYCGELDIQIAGGQTCVSSAVRQVVAAVTGYGRPFEAGACSGESDAREGNDSLGRKAGDSERSSRSERRSGKKVHAGQDIVISKWIGLEGTAMLAKRHKNKLLARYPAYFVEEAAGFDRFLSVIPEAATAVKSGVCGMHDVSRGGIFAALWEMASGAGVGLHVDFKKLPVRQETIEICEYFALNPYELLSGGCLIMTAQDGEKLVVELTGAGIPAVIVGKTTDSNDRVLYNGEEKRFLDMPKTDQIYHIFSKKK